MNMFTVVPSITDETTFNVLDSEGAIIDSFKDENAAKEYVRVCERMCVLEVKPVHHYRTMIYRVERVEGE